MKSPNEPDIALAGLRIWLHNRQFPDLEDYWDGNWMNATAEVLAEGARVKTGGPFIHLGDFQLWPNELRTLNQSLSGEANLQPLEPELTVRMKAESLGHITVEVNITPNQISQKHWFEFEVDQSYLPALISDLENALAKFQIRGEPEF